MRIPKFLVPALVCLFCPWVAHGAVAAAVSRFDVERLHPPPMAECSLVVGCAESGPAGAFRLSLDGMTSFSPVVLYEAGRIGGGGFGTPIRQGDVIAVRSAVNLLGAYAFTDGLEVHADLSLVVAQSRDDLWYRAVPRPGAWGTGSPVLGVRWTAWSQRRGAPLTAALRLDAVPPLGWRDALAGNSGWLLEPRVEVANWVEGGVVAAEVGLNLRGRTEQVGVERLGNEVTWALVAAGRGRPMRAEAALRGSGSRQGYGVELLLGFRTDAGPVELFALTGRGGGRAVGTPDIRVMLGVASSGVRSDPASMP
jgi:hypothetical protein